MTPLRRHLASGLATSLLVALLVAVTVAVVAVAPRALVRLGTSELRHELREQVPARVDLDGTGPVGFTEGGDAAALLGPVDEALARIPSRIPAPLSDGAGETRWLIRSQAFTGSAAQYPTVVLVMRLAIDLHGADGVRYVAGSEPRPWRGPGGPAAGAPSPIEIALSSETADAMGVKVGDTISVDPDPFLVTGIYDAVDPEERFWEHAGDLLEPQRIQEDGRPLKIQASALIAPDSVARLTDAFSAGELDAWIPIDPEAYDYSDLDVLRSQVRAVTATPIELPAGGTLGFRSVFDGVLGETRASVSATSALIALAASGFLAVLIAAYALCIQAVIRRRRAVLALGTARGAAPRQLRGIMMLEAALISVPGSIVAVVVARLLVPEDAGLAGWLLPACVALTPVALAGVLTTTSPARQGREDLGARWGGSVRWVSEIAVLLLSGVALFLLQRRGLIASSAVVGIDPLLSATPVLLAIAAGLLVLRLYPIPLRGLQRALRNRRAPAASVGSARAIREPSVGLIGTLAIVIGISITVFATGMISTVDHGLRQSAHDQVGADIQIAAHDLPATLITRLSELPRIGTAVALVSASGVEFADESGPTEVSVLLADTAALHRVRPDIPVLTGKVDGRLPILVSSDWVDRVDGTDLSIVNSRVTQVGVIDSDAVPGMSRHWILIDASAADEIGLAGQVPSRVLASIVAGADPAAAVADVERVVIAEQPDVFTQTVRVDDASSVLKRIRSAPVTSGLERSLLIVSVSTLVLTMLVVALAALTAAAARNRVVGVLRVLGMSPRQIRSLVAWEFAPVAAIAVVVGTALGLGLPYLVTAVLDLRGFLGGNATPLPVLEPAWICAAVAAFVIAVIGAVALATAAGRRLAPAGVLKMGEE